VIARCALFTRLPVPEGLFIGRKLSPGAHGAAEGVAQIHLPGRFRVALLLVRADEGVALPGVEYEAVDVAAEFAEGCGGAGVGHFLFSFLGVWY